MMISLSLWPKDFFQEVIWWCISVTLVLNSKITIVWHCLLDQSKSMKMTCPFVACSALVCRVFERHLLERKPLERLYHDMTWDDFALMYESWSGFPLIKQLLEWFSPVWAFDGLVLDWLNIEMIFPPDRLILGDLSLTDELLGQHNHWIPCP